MKSACEENANNIEKVLETKIVYESNTKVRYYKVQFSSWISENYLKEHYNDLIQEFWKEKPQESIDVLVSPPTTAVSNRIDTINPPQTDSFVNQDGGSYCSSTLFGKDAELKLHVTQSDKKRQKSFTHVRRQPSTRRKNPSKIPILLSDKEAIDDTADRDEDTADAISPPLDSTCPINYNSLNGSDIESVFVKPKTLKGSDSKGSSWTTRQETKSKTHRTVTCKDCGTLFNNSFYKEKCRYCTNTCRHCGKSFKRPSALRNHMEGVHEKAKKHRCEICSKYFTTRHYLTNHILKHNSTRSHECDICHKKYKDITKLKRHKLIHTGIKPYKCDVCQREFQQNEALKKHMLLHMDGPRRFQCPLCKKGFNHKVSLKSHMLKHHDKNEQQAAVMIGLWKKYQQMETNCESILNHGQNDVLSKALNDVVMIPQDSREYPMETDVDQSLPLLNFGGSLNLP